MGTGLVTRWSHAGCKPLVPSTSLENEQTPHAWKGSSIKPIAPHLPPPWQVLEAEGAMHAAPAAQTMHKGAAAEPVLGTAPSGVRTEMAMAQAVVVVPPPTQVLE